MIIFFYCHKIVYHSDINNLRIIYINITMNTDEPPPYKLCKYEWVYDINRSEAEIYLKSYTKHSKLGLYSDRLFLVRYKNIDTYAVSIYRYIPNCVYHYHLKKKNNYFIFNSLIVININKLDKVIEYLKTDLEIGYQLNNEIIPICNYSLIPKNSNAII